MTPLTRLTAKAVLTVAAVALATAPAAAAAAAADPESAILG
jgi:hypothetical protein